MSGTVPAQELHRVVATCVIYDDKRRFLIAKRSNREPFPNKWEIPGGGLKRSDYENLPYSGPDGTWQNPISAHLKREIKEEVNVEVDQLEYVDNFSFMQGKVPVIGFRFMARFVSGPVRLNQRETVDFRWIRAHEVSHYDLLGNVADVLKRVEQILAYKALKGGG